MSVELPEQIHDMLRSFASGCWALTSQGRTAVVLKIATDEIHGFWKSPIDVAVGSCPHDAVAGVCLCLGITKADGKRLQFENVWDISQGNQKRDAERLGTQEYFDLYFFDSETKYSFTRRIWLNDEHRRQVEIGISKSLAYLDANAQRARDLAKVRAHFTMDEDME